MQAPSSVVEATTVKVKVVDCDVHPQVTSDQDLVPYLPSGWEYLSRRDPPLPWRIDMTNGARRVDSHPPTGGPPGSDPAFLGQQLLDEAKVDLAIMVPIENGAMVDPRADAIRHAATNDWIADKWLGEEPNWHGRFYGSIRVPMQNPDAAVKEIERWAEDPRFIQILVFPGYSPPFGHPMYEPIWRAAIEHNLPIGSHPSNSGEGLNATSYGTYSSPTGSCGFFFDHHAMGYPSTFVAQLASMVCSGVFERYPELRFVVMEAGVSWSLALGDHLDRNWRRIREDAPELTELPSTYLKRNVMFSTQPIEEPDDEMLRFAYERLDAERRLVFSTDYPHWDFDDPSRALAPLPKDLRSRILGDTARELYGLPEERLAGNVAVA
jgi:uncharacterized protein